MSLRTLVGLPAVLLLITLVSASAADREALLNQWIQRAQSPDPTVRAEAAQVLGNLGSFAHRAVPVLAQQLRKETSKEIRTAMGNAMAPIGPASVPTLVKVINETRRESTPLRFLKKYEIRSKCERARLAWNAWWHLKQIKQISKVQK